MAGQKIDGSGRDRSRNVAELDGQVDPADQTLGIAVFYREAYDRMPREVSLQKLFRPIGIDFAVLLNVDEIGGVAHPHKLGEELSERLALRLDNLKAGESVMKLLKFRWGEGGENGDVNLLSDRLVGEALQGGEAL